MVSLGPASLAFGGTPVHTPSVTESITLTSTGDAPLTLSGPGEGITIGGAAIRSFSQTVTCGNSVTAGARCTIVVTFTPRLTGALRATVNVADNAAGSPQIVQLTGTGTEAEATLTPSSLAFPGTVVGQTAPAQPVTLKNTGNAPLILSSKGAGISFTGTGGGAFTETNTCGASLVPSLQCVIHVAIKPQTAGAVSANLKVTDNAGNSPQNVTLGGTGMAPAVALTPSSLDFAGSPIGEKSFQQTIGLQNTGNAPLVLSGSGNSMTGADARLLSETNNCGTRLVAGEVHHRRRIQVP